MNTPLVKLIKDRLEEITDAEYSIEQPGETNAVITLAESSQLEACYISDGLNTLPQFKARYNGRSFQTIHVTLRYNSFTSPAK